MPTRRVTRKQPRGSLLISFLRLRSSLGLGSLALPKQLLIYYDKTKGHQREMWQRAELMFSPKHHLRGPKKSTHTDVGAQHNEQPAGFFPPQARKSNSCNDNVTFFLPPCKYKSCLLNKEKVKKKEGSPHRVHIRLSLHHPERTHKKGSPFFCS